jgi:Tol biopolymer transport system component
MFKTLRFHFFIFIALLPMVLLGQERPATEKPKESASSETEVNESDYLSKIRQLTFEGLRAGEGYFSADGSKMVFQSERDPANPFYQIFWMNRETGDIEKISPGHGKTTCAWIHPDGHRVLFASTQFDPEALTKQQAELDFRASGKTRRYSWDYDPTYDLIVYDRKTKQYSQLTHAEGYDAEGSYSPDGEWIAFASNRRAFSDQLTDAQKERFAIDPSWGMDLYIMKADGSDLKQITDVPGYDGGPFFSPDGRKLCWRRFNESGEQAEIYTANVDGSDAKRLTSLNAMSWAPYFHPSGDYLIFTTNIHGFGNFELYVVDAAGVKEPVRITTTDGFDGLPVFTPDGKSLAWTSNRTPDKKSQIFIAEWNDARIRDRLKLSTTLQPQSLTRASLPVGDSQARSTAQANRLSSSDDYSPSDIGRHVDYLCRPELGGRLTGTEGERNATSYVAAFMEDLGLEPAGENGTFFQEFPFTASIQLGPGNELKADESSFEVNEQWRPLVFSKTGRIEAAEVVFAGYGLVAAKDGDHPEYDSYVHLDVEGKWVMVFRNLPSDISPERRQHLSRASSLRFKAMAARDRGAIGLIVVSGPTSQVREQLVPLQTDGSLSGSSIAAISVKDSVALEWFKSTGENLAEIQKELDTGELMMGIPLKDVRVSANIDVQPLKKIGRNVIGRLRKSDADGQTALIVGAHIDHLGVGASGDSLALEEEKNGIHRGADDNASGVAAMLEIAQSLSQQKKASSLNLAHDVLFAAWSGEELGLIGSSYFVEHLPWAKASVKSTGDDVTPADEPALYPSIVACLNLDMVGRLRDKLILQGIASSTAWPTEIERRNAVVGLSLTLQNDSYLPTDASSFYMRGVPILSAFTGQHSEYHTPRDTPELLNYEGAAQTARLLGLIARSVAAQETPPPFVQQTAPENQGMKANLLASLGTIPDYGQGDIPGVKLAGVKPGGAAAEVGVQAKDIVIELAGKKIENVYDYTYAIDALKVGQETEIVVLRDQQSIRLKIVPKSRQ